MSGFVVQGPKSDYRDSSGLKNRLFPIFYNAFSMDLVLIQFLNHATTSHPSLSH